MILMALCSGNKHINKMQRNFSFSVFLFNAYLGRKNYNFCILKCLKLSLEYIKGYVLLIIRIQELEFFNIYYVTKFVLNVLNVYKCFESS